MEMPNPAPMSGNCDVVKIWNGNNAHASQQESAAPANTVTSSIPQAAPMPTSAPVSSAPVASAPTSSEIVQIPSFTQAAPVENKPAPAPAPVEEKFDDSFVVTTPVPSAPQQAVPEMPAPVVNTAPTGPILEIDDDDDGDKGIDFE